MTEEPEERQRPQHQRSIAMDAGGVDDPSQPPLFRWRAHAHLLYENWLNYYVYQNTPYDLGEMQRVKHSEG